MMRSTATRCAYCGRSTRSITPPRNTSCTCWFRVIKKGELDRSLSRSQSPSSSAHGLYSASSHQTFIILDLARMVKFDDDFVLKAGVVMAAAWAAPHLAMPNEVSDRMYTTQVTRPALGHAGIAVGACSACSLVAANSSDKKVKKNTLKVQGAATLAHAANNLWSGLKDKTQKRDISIAGSVPLVALGITSLVMGFRD